MPSSSTVTASHWSSAMSAPRTTRLLVRRVLERVARRGSPGSGRPARRRPRSAAGRGRHRRRAARPAATSRGRRASRATSDANVVTPRSRISGSAWRWVTSRISSTRVAQPLGGLVDPLDVVALLGRFEREVQECLGIATDEGQGRPELVAHRRDETLAQFLERPDGADVTQDRGRARVAIRHRSDAGTAIARRRPGSGAPSAPRIAVSR